MGNASVLESVKQLGKTTIEKLDKLKIPPYPKYYSETFIDLLYDSDDEELISFFKDNPRYLQENKSIENLLKNSLFVARDSVYRFENSNENLKIISNEQGIELEQFGEEVDSKTQELFNILKKFQNKISEQMVDSDKHIFELRSRIENLENGVNINPLTKMPNLVEFEKDMQVMFNRGMKENLDMFLISIDADNFNSICSTFGRLAGDKTIIYLSTLLRNSLRNGTKVYHVDYDEFYILLNRIEREQSIRIINRIIAEVSKSKLFYKGNNINLTISAGITQHKQKDNITTIMKRVKNAIKKAKQKGNCFEEEL